MLRLRVRRGWGIVAAFAVTQTVGYGVLYYAFAVLLQPMATALDASAATVTGALTASVLAGAALSVPVGRWLDRHGGRALMTVGSLLATALVVAWSQVRTVAQLYAVLIGIGLTTAMVLYEPALTVVVSWFDPARRSRAVLAVIVVAGFASTIFLPLTAVLVDRYGWRTALLVLAGIHGALTVPLHAFAVRPPPAPPARHTDGTHAGIVRAAVRDARFWFLATAFVAHSAAMAAMTVHLVGFLVHSGHPATFAATVAGLLGVLSVTGRLLLTAAHRRWRLTTVVTVVFGVQALAAFALPLIAAGPIGAAAGVTAFGIGFGVASLTRPQLLADRYGTLAYGTINGILATPVTVARAVAPMAAAGLLGATSYPAVLAAIGGTCLVAAVGIAAVGIAAHAGTPSPVTEDGS
ncbi:MFS transporter [Virgisporangium aurantiacum]|uniref:MFS transporter n=1 Tax=Virgisporangium aurantiacum TaxID=175570 RepID=A0A8J4E864_9ACTN|nr:MFS transporter [Virgisporangium aurantiacum]GIJ62487.1 MFS transporter [Virgisporangium aurantiacum]